MPACGGSGSWGKEYCLSDLDNWTWTMSDNITHYMVFGEQCGGCSTAAKVIGSSAMLQIAV